MLCYYIPASQLPAGDKLKHRTTIYLSKIGRECAEPLIKNRQLSRICEQAILNNAGMSSDSAVLEQKIEEKKAELSALMNHHVNMSVHEDNFNRYCELIHGRMRYAGMTATQAIDVLSIHLDKEPMCSMSRDELIKEVERRYDE